MTMSNSRQITTGISSYNIPTRSDCSESHNRLLAALLREGGDRLRRDLEPVFLPYRKVLFEPGAPPTRIYFPLCSVVAITHEFRDGTTTQMATVGSEGLVPIHALLGSELAHDRHVVQVAGTAISIRTATLLGAMENSPLRCRVFAAFVQRFLSGVLQSVACNALHSVEERCARWLLTTADSTRSTRFALTQEFLAELLGVHRPTVSLALRALRETGLIRCSRGSLEIVDRDLLEGASCECYWIIRQKEEHVLRAGLV